MKIDTVHDLIYVKGAVPGVDDTFVNVRDSIRAGWRKDLFPADAAVPFPTYLPIPNENGMMIEEITERELNSIESIDFLNKRLAMA